MPILLWRTGFAFSLVLLLSFGASAQPYSPGHGALEIWNAEGRANVPAAIAIWLRVMVITFACGLFFIWKRVEARWVVGGLLIALLITRVGIPMMGIVKLSGLVALVHLIFWSPGLYFLLSRRPFLKERSAYGVWSGFATSVIIISFVFDIRDAAIYLDHIIGISILS